MFKNQSNVLKENELSPAVREYLNLCNDSSDLIKFMSDQNNEISLGSENEASLLCDNLDYMSRSENFQDGRAPSPASISSLASGRRLEWDSGADVGYQPSTATYPNTLSTLERMALGGCAEALIRTDPEGTNSCASGVAGAVNLMHTSLTPSSQTPRNDYKAQDESKSVTSPREVSGVVKLPMFASNEAVSLNSDREERDPNENSLCHSASDDDIRDCTSAEADGNNRLRNDEGEVCPVNKNVNENASSDEDAIFKPLKSGMNTNSASSSSLASTIVNPVLDTQQAHSKKLKSYKKVVTRGIQVGGALQRSESVQILESILSSGNSHHTEDEDAGKDFHGDSCKNTLVTVPESIDTSSFDRANSFEYFPGDMCDRSALRKDVSEKKESKSDATLKECHSLSKDLEEYIARVIQKKLSTSKKKALVKELVEKIIESEYCDDVEDKQIPKKSSESSIRSGHSTPGSTEESAEPKQNKGTDEEKIFVPYRPIPGGKTYLVAGEKVVQSSETSRSYSGTETSRPAVYYLPADRIKPMKHLNSTTDERPDSVQSDRVPKVDDERYNSCLKRLKELREQLKNKHLVADFSESEGSSRTQDNHYYSSKERPQKQRWWSPDTKSEKKHMVEATKKKQNPVLNYLERERESQLNWIKNEINHLSNLARLLQECEISKADSSTSLEEQMSLLSSLKGTRKASKNVSNNADKLLSSAKSSFVEEPIVPALKNPPYSSQERLSQSTSPLMQRHSTKETSVDYCSNQSTVASSSVPSRMSSRNSATSDPRPAEKVHRDNDNKKTSEAYLITFEAGTPENDLKEEREKALRKSLKEVKVKIPRNKQETNGNRQTECYTVTSLKEQLEVHRPEFIRNAEERQKCLEELARLRALRQATRRKLLHFNLITHQNLQKEKQDMPKPNLAPAKPIRRQKENSAPVCLREKRRLKRALPEYQKKEAEQKKKQYYQTNRLLADIYSKKLQKKVLNGAVSLSMSESVISTL